MDSLFPKREACSTAMQNLRPRRFWFNSVNTLHRLKGPTFGSRFGENQEDGNKQFMKKQNDKTSKCFIKTPIYTARVV